MSKNDSFKDPKKAKKLEDTVKSGSKVKTINIDVFDPESESMVQTTAEDLKNSFYKPSDKPAVSVVYKVVYPDELNLKLVSTSQKAKARAGRPKRSTVAPQEPDEQPPDPQKSKIQVLSKTRSGREMKFPKYIQSDFKKNEIDDDYSPAAEPPPAPQKSKIQVLSKTRSGREVKFPKYIQSDFKKIEIDNDHSPADPNECYIKTTDFVKYTEKSKQKEEPKIKKEKPLELDSVQKKRRIASQYRCPKCKKAYLGRNRILEHLKKNPSHGPMHQNEENHFEVWNYLVSITQKCPSSERGPKFCQELSNLLHNLLLLTNALFKKLGSASNEVKIDKVLGNAIGLDPGSYYFDDNNLYKDVTVLQLMGNTDFLNSIRSKTDDFKASEKNCNCGKLSTIDELVLTSMLISSEANDSIAKKIDGIKINQHEPSPLENKDENTRNCGEIDFFVPSRANLTNYSPTTQDYDMKSEVENNRSSSDAVTNREVESNFKVFVSICDEKDILQPQSGNFKPNIHIKNHTGNDYFSSKLNYSTNNFYTAQEGVLNDVNIDSVDNKLSPKSPKIKIQSNILICPPNPKFIPANCNNKTFNEHKNRINPELLTDNSVLMPMPNLQHSVDELMLPVPSEPGNILDNSSSSDEVMNVDQFVNERFRRITETDLEVTNSSNSLNLDLPALDLFQFHTS